MNKKKTTKQQLLEIYEKDLEQADAKTETILEESHKLWMHEKMQRHFGLFEKRWSKYKEAFGAYINGMRVMEISKRFNIPRCEFYALLREFNIPFSPVSHEQLSLMARKIRANTRMRDLNKLRKCQCGVCEYLLRKMERQYKFGGYE